MMLRKVHFNLTLIVITLTTPAFAGQIKDPGKPEIVRQIGQSALLRAESQNILLLQGTPYQMGYAHGKLLEDKVHATVDGVLRFAQMAQAKKDGKPSLDTLEEIYQRTLPYVPGRFKEELAGLADGAGIDRHKVNLANAFPEMFHCSVFALMNRATKDGKLIHGRILDYAAGSGLQQHAVVIITRSPGCNATISASYAGLVGTITGMNDKHISIGMMGMSNYGRWDGKPMTYMLRQSLEESDEIDEVVDILRRSARTCRYAYVIADAKAPSAVSVHTSPSICNVTESGKSCKRWPVAIPDAVAVSAGDRYELLTKRIKKNYGSIDVPVTIEMMKRPVAMKSNLHNAVMLPASLTIYIADAAMPSPSPDAKTQACYQPYYEYDMKKYLKIMDKLAENPNTSPNRVPLTTQKSR